MAQLCCWPYMNGDLLSVPYFVNHALLSVKIFKSVVSAKQYQSLNLCIVNNGGIQIEFDGHINNE